MSGENGSPSNGFEYEYDGNDAELLMEEEENEGDHKKKLYVKNISDNVDEEKLTSIFHRFGTITSVKIMRTEEGISRGFGFVCFASPEEASNALSQMKSYSLGNRRIYVERAMSKVERDQYLKSRKEEQTKWNGQTLYVKNLDESVDEDKLREAFEKYGSVTSVKIMKNEDGVSRRFGFVGFDSSEEASNALTHMRNSQFVNKRLYVAIAQPLAQRRSHGNRRGGPSRGRMPIPHPLQYSPVYYDPFYSYPHYMSLPPRINGFPTHPQMLIPEQRAPLQHSDFGLEVLRSLFDNNAWQNIVSDLLNAKTEYLIQNANDRTKIVSSIVTELQGFVDSDNQSRALTETAELLQNPERISFKLSENRKESAFFS